MSRQNILMGEAEATCLLLTWKWVAGIVETWM